MNTVYLVGAGCGEGSLTLRGAELIGACDCLVYDSLIDEEILRLAKPSCRKIFAGKRAGAHGMSQEEINALLAECAAKYPCTVRLKGGDPFVFGRGGEELLALKRAGVYAECVPGVTGAVAAAELFGIPVTHRGLSRGFRVVAAHTEEGEADFTRYAKEEDTLVFLMAKAAAESIARGLIGGGMREDTPAAVISRAGFADGAAARCLLKDIGKEAEKLPAPMTVVVGGVCAFGAGLPENAPRAVATGTKAHVSRVLPLMRAAGFRAAGLCHLAVRQRDFDAFFAQISAFDWLVFTSANGVRVFFERVREKGIDLRVFGNKKFAVIGGATAEALGKFGFHADVMPKNYTAEALAEALKARGADKEKTALLRASQGSPALSGAGVQFDLYETISDELALARADRALEGAQFITFSSAGGVRALLDRCALPKGALPVAIGEETARALRERGYAPIVAENASAEALVRAMAAQKEKTCRD